MFSWYQRQKLIHQIGLVILLGFVLSFLLTLFLLSYDKSQRLSQLSVFAAVQRVISVADTLAQTEPTLHDTILTASSSSDLQLSLSNAPRVAQQTSNDGLSRKLLSRLKAAGIEQAHILLVSQAERPLMDLRAMNAMHRNMMGSDSQTSMMNQRFSPRHRGQRLSYSATVDGSVQLANGKWLNFSSGIENDITHWSTSVLIALISVMLLTVFIALLITRKALQPIAELGKAAQSFATSKQVHKVSTQAPQDLVPAISAFNNMQQQLTDYIKERTKLLAAISHDLRTPLTSLRLRLEFIEPSEDQQQALRTVETMDKMLTATLRFAKNDAEQEPRQNTNIDSLLQTIVDEYGDKNVPLQYQCQPGLVGNVAPLALRRMTENLINNAIQHAGSDAEIRICVASDDEQLQLSIADNGVGIPEDKLQEVLKPFTRLDDARDTDSANVGLGLSITQSLVANYGGQLQLQSNRPHGLVATISLPLV
ncbi:hypothetical protein HR45_05055 [Shewanella mangrovi]|uniref:histidine kinase n=1 Tax=Shewanella mangrovi TaxID=1515746 RepID=A0A094LUB1_9GAMM|nr:HAMP domain-containing sensor histidine kinase [Shewanella mangrovi]KFZ38783.1 hypothetical protein HR45_05055 [Shewanella mangrovi]